MPLGTNIQEIYQNKLGRAGDQAGIDYWQGQQAGGMSLDDIRSSIAGSGEARGAIESLYQPALGRDADQAGVNYFMGDLQGGQSLSDVNRSIQAGRGYDTGAGAAGQYDTGVGGRLESGLGGAVSQYDKAIDRSGQGLDQFSQTLSPYAEGGQAAYQKQLAFTGALGPEAQQAAYEGYNASPEQDWLQEQMRRETDNYASATGQSQGGNVLAELQRRALGLAQQDFGKSFNRLGQTANLGGQAASQLATGQLGSGQFDAGMMGNLGQMRYGAGQQLAGQLGQTTSALAGLQQQQGLTDADIYGQGAANVGNVLGQAGQQMTQLPLDVATLISNLATQTGSQQAPYLANQGAYDAAGVKGQYDAYGNMIGAGLDAWEQR